MARPKKTTNTSQAGAPSANKAPIKKPKAPPQTPRKLTDAEREQYRKVPGRNGGTLIPFRKKDAEGKPDPRLNMTGTATSIESLRDIIQSFLSQQHGKRKKTELLAMLERMVISKMALDRKTLLEYGFGKVPDKLEEEVNLNVKGYVVISPDDWDIDPQTRSATRKKKQEEDDGEDQE